MRVLQINSVCGTGSTGKLAVQISGCLSEHGIENDIAYGFGQSPLPNAFRFGNMADAHLHSFLSRKLCIQGYGSYFTTGKLIRYMKKRKPDIVHLHNIHGHYLHFPRLFRYLKEADCHVVWTFHDCWPMTGKCTHFTQAGCEKWKTQCFACPQLATYPDSERDRSRQNYLDKKRCFAGLEKLHIVTVSRWLKGIAEASFLAGKDIRCIYNGIDTGVFRPCGSDFRESSGVGDRFMILGVAGPWNERKGYGRFLELARRLDAESVLVLVGVSEAQKAALPENVIGITRTENQHQLARIYSAADVLVSLSLEETFGLVVAEALACGTPAIVVNSTACPEVISADTGIVIPPDDDAALDRALGQIREKTISPEACVRRARQCFSSREMQRQYYLLYRELENQI